MHCRKLILSGRLTAVAVAVPGEDAPAAVAPAVETPPPPELPVLRATLAQLQRLIATVQAQQAATIEDITKTSVALAVALAERLVGAEIAGNQQRLDRILRQALEKMRPAHAVAICGHADDLALLERQIRENSELEPYRDLLTLRPTVQHQRGQLKVEGGDWFIDWDTQRALAELRDALLEEAFAEE